MRPLSRSRPGRRCFRQSPLVPLGHRHWLSGALVARTEKMNEEEFEKAIAEVAERLELYLEQRVDTRLEAEEEQQQG